MQKSEKSLEPFLRKLRYQPTNQPTNNTDLIGPRWRRPKNTIWQNSSFSAFYEFYFMNY